MGVVDGWGRVRLDFWRSTPLPIVQMLRRTTRLCRLTCPNCPDVQRWTKTLEFLYCGCRTVINLSWECHLENGGWGVGGAFKIQKSSMRIGCSLEEFKFVTYTNSGQEVLSQFCPTNQSENGSRLQAWSVRSCWFCWKPSPPYKWHCWPFMTCAKLLTVAWPSRMWSC